MTPWGIYKPKRVPQGASDSPLHFQNCLMQIFQEPIRGDWLVLWIDDTVIHAPTWDLFIVRLTTFLSICRKVQLQISIKKTNLVAAEVVFCGRQINGESCTLLPRNIEAFRLMLEPTKAGQLSQFLMGVNWMRECLTPLGPNIKPADNSFAALSRPLWNILDECYGLANSRKKRKYQNILLVDVGWGEPHKFAFKAIKDKLDALIRKAYPKRGARFCLHTDASDDHYALMLTQVVNWIEGLPVHEQEHEPLAVKSGSFRDSECRWRICEKEAYPIILSITEW